MPVAINLAKYAGPGAAATARPASTSSFATTTTAIHACRSMRRTACTAKPATSRTRRRTSSGSRPKSGGEYPTTPACEAQGASLNRSRKACHGCPRHCGSATSRSLKPAALNSITAAAAFGVSVDVLVAGHEALRWPRRLPPCRAWCACCTPMRRRSPASWPRASLHWWSRWPVNTTPSSFRRPPGQNVAPRVAAQLDVAQISDVTRVVSMNTFERPIYAGNATATTVRSKDRIKVLTVRTTAFDAQHPRAAAMRAPCADGGGGGCGDVGLRGRRDRQARPPGNRSPPPGSSAATVACWICGEVRRGAHAAGRRARREPRRRRRRLCVQRLAGRPDRQDRRAACRCTRPTASAAASAWRA